MALISLLLHLILTLINKSSPAPVTENELKECFAQSSEESTTVFLTISSLYVSTTEDGVVQRQLEMNWAGGQPVAGDKVSVYNRDPTVHSTAKPILSISPLNYSGGYFRTPIVIPVTFMNTSRLSKDHCLGYWIAYHNNESNIESSSCLRIRPFWMEENSKYLSQLKLNEVMIPGSHDSGSFYYRKEDGPLTKYKYAQEEDIFSQMTYGLRYFDLRVGYYKKSKEKYYINHNFLRTDHSVKSVLHQVLKFLKATKREIIILDFHNFPVGFNDKFIHEKLMMMIIHILGPYLIPTSKDFRNATFSHMWKHNKRVLVSYDSDTRKHFFGKYLWPSIIRAWGNKQYPEDLKTYFEDVFDNPIPEGIWASMAELTPNTKTIILHPETGLRVFADMINRNVTHWFRDLFWQKANIVATDYFLGNNIIDVAINANRIKGLCPENSWTKLKP